MSVHIVIYIYNMFQFLIGTIKTNGNKRDIDIRLGVSIPYRYYKNQNLKKYYFMTLFVFQFLIGTIKTSSNK